MIDQMDVDARMIVSLYHGAKTRTDFLLATNQMGIPSEQAKMYWHIINATVDLMPNSDNKE